MEIMDVYNAQKEKTGRTHQRDIPMQPGDYRLVVSVILFNSQGQTLIQQRSGAKYSWPLYWDFAASGAVETGEQPYQAAERELFEELGIKIDLKNTPSRLTVAFEEGWDEIYFAQVDVDVADLVLQKAEVVAARWVNERELLGLLEEGKFIPYIHAKHIFDYFNSKNEQYKNRP